MDSQFDCLMSAHQTLLQRYAELADRVDKQDLIIQDLVKKNTELHEYVYENEAFMSEFVSSYNSKMNEIFYMNENVSNTMLDAVDHKIKKELGPIDEQLNEFVKNHEDTVGSLATKFSRFDKTFAKTMRETNEKIDKQDMIILNLLEKNTQQREIIESLNKQIADINSAHKFDEYKKVLIGYKQSSIGHIPVFANIKQFDNLYREVDIFILESLLELNIKILNLFPNMRFLNDDDNGFSILGGPPNGIFIPYTLKLVFDFCNKHNISVLYCGSDKWEGKYISEYLL